MKKLPTLAEIDKLITKLLKAGDTPTKIANSLSHKKRFSHLKFNTIRNRAWYRQKLIGPKRDRSASRTKHGNIVSYWKKKLQKKGFTVVWRQHEIQKYMNVLGVPKSNPDLFATKPKMLKLIKEELDKIPLYRELFPASFDKRQILLVEIVDGGKTAPVLADQIERYKKVGKVIIVLPFSISGVSFVGYD